VDLTAYALLCHLTLTVIHSMPTTLSSGARLSVESLLEADFMPEHGWVVELEEAKHASKKLRTGEERIEAGGHKEPKMDIGRKEEDAAVVAQCRVARAYFTLRQWQKCKIASELALSTVATNKADASSKALLRLKKLLRGYRDRAITELATEKAKNPKSDNTLADIVRRDLNVDHTSMPHETFRNSNVLHCSALYGDVGTVEALIALGAAIDYPSWILVLKLSCLPTPVQPSSPSFAEPLPYMA